jgi:hypothetical protein
MASEEKIGKKVVFAQVNSTEKASKQQPFAH